MKSIAATNFLSVLFHVNRPYSTSTEFLKMNIVLLSLFFLHTFDEFVFSSTKNNQGSSRISLKVEFRIISYI